MVAAGPKPAASSSGGAERPNHVWALDFQFDETTDHRWLLNIVDEHNREALAMRVGRSCDADQVVTVIEALVATRGAPGHLRMDNGPEVIAWALRTGVTSPARSPPTSSPARRGRTLSSRALLV